ncbi:triose-phosphate transporter family-domain-containing protein [Gilbertella persicaria]|uniref:triose-phosphate transporter family-domain-containing protein n=1 Tax=Gilbertella persicaria TaxID=101096 RepID=UPI00221E5754|nr:triose-phosphate transporter family-domain-containing protein [Gilbertella persicaria]KAI8094910.1 triose-phosphate transporter family-domain-containing protein [Gilbertella persicaria]
MSPTKISPRKDMVSAAEGYPTYEDINKAKLRYQPQEDLLHDSKMTQEAFGTIRAFSKTQNSSLLSFLDQPTKEPDINNDLSTRHTENYYDDSRFKEAIKSRLSLGNHFTVSDNLKFILNCCMWYLSSSLTNNIGKSIMNAFQFPVTLTFVQFGLVAFWCYLVSIVFKATHIRSPTHEIIKTIAPLAIFLIVGHIFSSVAISRVPVSLVHTIKALAPLFTVAFYRFIFHVRYSEKVYISLCPLTLGVILACSFTFSNNFVGLACALGSCLVFVTQNIFSKKLLFKESKLGDRNPNKLDKLNVLFYSSLLSFLLMAPLWLFYDGNSLLTTQKQDSDMTTSTLLFYFFVNGTMNFAQNWFAFTTLSLTSPVTYSILSLLKRIFVIVMSIVWFGQQITWTQGIGILLTFLGLYMYQNAKSDVDKGETKIRENAIDLLPMQNTLAEKSFWIPNNDMKSL